jgi:transglutaminase-like putative cysteine protease
MRYRLRLLIHYAFARPSGGGRQLLRIRPAELAGVQRVISAELKVTPAPAEQRGFRDFFGTMVNEVVMPPGLKEISFELKAKVERTSKAQGLDISPPLAQLAGEIAGQRSLGPDAPHHFLPASRRIPHVPDIAAFAREAAAGAGTVREAVERLGLALHAAMTFDAKATEVDTPIAVAFAGREGVCQDFSQIMIAGLRSLGIPSAYVAGYLRTLPPPGKKRLQGADAMHAWVRAWTGADGAWVEYDPTNACFVGQDHIVMGYGRDYSDVAPVTGMLRLESSQRGRHSVDIVEY